SVDGCTHKAIAYPLLGWISRNDPKASQFAVFSHQIDEAEACDFLNRQLGKPRQRLFIVECASEDGSHIGQEFLCSLNALRVRHIAQRYGEDLLAAHFEL